MQTDRDASDAVSDLRNGLTRNLRALETIIPIGMTSAQWSAQAERLLRDRREWLRIEWRDSQLKLLAGANNPSRPALLTPLGPDHLLPEINLACTQARRAGTASYSPSNYIVSDQGAGVEVVELCLPWSLDGEIRGYLIASYSLSDVLTGMVSTNLYRSQQISFVEPDGTRLAMVGQIREGKRSFNSQQMLSLPGASLMVRIDSRRMGPDLFPNLLTAAVAALSLALVTVLALLGRDTRRRQKAEHELAEEIGRAHV